MNYLWQNLTENNLQSARKLVDELALKELGDPEELIEYFDQGDQNFLIVDKTSKEPLAVIGTVVGNAPQEIWINYLLVGPKHRRQNIASDLLEEIPDQLELDFSKFKLILKATVHEDNQAAINLIQKAGFELVKTFANSEYQNWQKKFDKN
jgi:ribosomal protein S18 acetylase RimI-like enzyme